MTIETDADLSVFLADFGVVVTLAGNTEITAIFDSFPESVSLLQSSIDSNEPQLVCRTSDVQSVEHGDSLTVRSETYIVRGISSDGTGLTTLTLEKST